MGRHAFSCLVVSLFLNGSALADGKLIKGNAAQLHGALKSHVGKQVVIHFVQNGRAGTMKGAIKEVSPAWVRLTGREAVHPSIRHVVGKDEIDFDRSIPFAGHDYVTAAELSK
jgi:hypothetical protein